MLAKQASWMLNYKVLAAAILKPWSPQLQSAFLIKYTLLCHQLLTWIFRILETYFNNYRNQL